MDVKAVLSKIRLIEIRSRSLSGQLFSGGTRSSLRGRGMAFSEVREYQFGDEVRTIDWNVTARLNEPYVKVFEEEKERSVMLLLDVSGSMNYGIGRQVKKELMIEIAATLAFSAIHNNDKIGALFFTDKIEKIIPPKKGTRHVYRIVREFFDFQPSGTLSSLENPLKAYSHIVKNRSTVFLISDFLVTEKMEGILAQLRKKHELNAIRIVDKTEEEIPQMGIIRVKDPETGRVSWMDTSSHKVRNEFKENRKKLKEMTAFIFRKNKVVFTDIYTDTDPFIALKKLFA